MEEETSLTSPQSLASTSYFLKHFKDILMFLISQLIKFLKSYRETLDQIEKISSKRNEKPIDI